ncbi:MAG: hypothetical protein KDD67_06500 [Ignavibacteriae bacterium]|nr:hypothetical protein [Ignavibacteriota bacterium]MCB9215586.1 hypothetical protein [Ignavibacteria bacterium]
MFKFFRKKSELVIPEFPSLQSSEIKDKYFRRSAKWYSLDEGMIAVKEPYRPRFLTMEPWPQKVFLDADGKKTVEEYVYHTAAGYNVRQGVPPELADLILEIINDFAENYKIIELVDTVSELPDSFLKSQ